jgi:hypothetical protein
MAVLQPPNQLKEPEHPDERLLREVHRMDELLLDELERVDELLIRTEAEIGQLPERVASAIGRDQLGPPTGSGARAAKSARSRAPTRPFDPYGEDKVEIATAEQKTGAAARVAGAVETWLAAYAQDRDPTRVAALSLAVAVLAIGIAVGSFMAAVLH